jgi:hypothetical protein
MIAWRRPLGRGGSYVVVVVVVLHSCALQFVSVS